MLKLIKSIKPVSFNRDRLIAICKIDDAFKSYHVYECVLPASVFISSVEFEFIKKEFNSDLDVVMFSETPLHIDDTMVDAFIHYVVEGEFTVHLGDVDLTVKPGDVFIMDPKKAHSVSAMGMCITLCKEIENGQSIQNGLSLLTCLRQF